MSDDAMTHMPGLIEDVNRCLCFSGFAKSRRLLEFQERTLSSSFHARGSAAAPQVIGTDKQLDGNLEQDRFSAVHAFEIL